MDTEHLCHGFVNPSEEPGTDPAQEMGAVGSLESSVLGDKSSVIMTTSSEQHSSGVSPHTKITGTALMLIQTLSNQLGLV